jgi:hypothetical protein
MGLGHSPRIVTDGLVLALDAGNAKSSYKNFIKAKVYSVYSGGLRSANYSVQYSDDNSNWTTAFSGVCSNNTSCGIQENTGLGNGSYGYRRYWRYVEGSEVVDHHPRVSRIILTDVNGIDYNLIVYTSDNCSDTGTYIVGTVSVDFATNIWTDLSGNSNTGTLTNGPTYSSANGGSVSFDGTDEYATVPSNSGWAFGGNGTVEQWVYVAGNSGGNDRFWCVNNNSTSLDAYLNGASYNIGFHGGVVLTTTTIPQNTWVHFVVVYTSGTIKVYFNTIEQGLTGTTTGYNITSNGTLYIGRYITAPYELNGRIASMKIYNRALTASEIQQNFNALRGRFGI